MNVFQCIALQFLELQYYIAVLTGAVITSYQPKGFIVCLFVMYLKDYNLKIDKLAQFIA